MALPYERPVHWIGSSKEDLRATPEDVQDVIGRALQKVQWGGKPINSSFWRGAGSGVLEIKDDYDGDTYRCVYTVRFAKAVYVLHVFQKKSTSGIKTSARDVEMIKARLVAAKTDYAANYSV
jgi:phage-related protein